MNEETNDLLDEWFLNERNKELFPGVGMTKIVHMGKIRKAIGIPRSRLLVLPKEGIALGEEFETVMGVDGFLYLLLKAEN